MKNRIIRVFPRRTRQTPNDELVRVGVPPGLFDHEVGATEIHVSVTFTWDLKSAEALAYQWESVAPVKLGGPATGDPGGEFTPGMYLGPGYTITSRGCPNKCWFCSVWKREGREVRELEIKPGRIVQDDNLLACSPEHIRAVFDMLEGQPKPKGLLGGLEAARLEAWHVDRMKSAGVDSLFCAYDRPEQLEAVREAGRLLIAGGYRRHQSIRCYVLCGYKGDRFDLAEARLRDAWEAGFLPFAMLYRDRNNRTDPNWRRFQKVFARPAKIRAIFGKGSKLFDGPDLF